MHAHKSSNESTEQCMRGEDREKIVTGSAGTHNIVSPKCCLEQFPLFFFKLG